jgi:CRISPR-associated protein Cas1
LLRTIEKPFDRFFEEGSIGYRKGGSREKAVGMVQQAIRDGFQYVVESDISDFFPSVNLETLCGLLDAYLPEGDRLLRSLLRKCLYTPYLFRGELRQRRQGLAQGSPLSPILANLYLDAFDEHMASLGVKLIRYADDFIFMTRSREQAAAALAEAQRFLAELGLRTEPEKTAVRSVADGFQFLGIRFTRSEAVVQPEDQIRRFKKPLYVTEPYAFLSLNGDAVEVLRDRTPLQAFPLRRLSEIIVMENASFSTALLRRCTEADVPVTITLGSGYYVTTVKPDSKEYYRVAFEHARRFGDLGDTERLVIAKDIAVARIANAMGLFRQRYSPRIGRVLELLEERIRSVEEAPDLDAVRGLEGAAARLIYGSFNHLVDDAAFHLRKRVRDKPDRINSLLNLGYYLLYGRINATLRAVGLNPYLGFLHSPENVYESLVADLQEPFRARVERLVLRLVNLRVIAPADFVETSRGAYLTREAKKRFLNHFERELARSAGKDRLPLGEWIYYQVLIVKKWALEGTSLTFYRWQL